MISVSLSVANSAFDECASDAAADIFRRFAQRAGELSRDELENAKIDLRDLNGNIVGSVEMDDLGNAAFEEDAGAELKRIFAELADKLNKEGASRENFAGEEYRLRDINGNTVGKLEVQQLSQGISI